jgi:hypothetical protein
VIRGSCLCGGVQFELPETPTDIRFCHCASCKKLAGGAATANARVRSDSITILEGEALLRSFQPPEGSAKTFCLACGSNLFGGGWPASEFCSVRVTTFADDFDARPAAHIFTRSAAPWETLPEDGADRFETTSG